MLNFEIQPELKNIPEAIRFVETGFEKYKLPSKEIKKAMLLAEETIVQLIETAEVSGSISLFVKKTVGLVSLQIRARGKEFSVAEYPGFSSALDFDYVDDESQSFVRSIILNSFQDSYKIRYKNGINTISICPQNSSTANLARCGIAFALALILGFGCRFLLPKEFCEVLITWLLSPLNTIFMNLLKMVMVPVVFFSIASCVSSFTDTKLLGRIGAKVMAFYMFTTIMAIFSAICMFHLFDPVEKGAFTSLVVSQTEAGGAQISFVDSIIGLFSDNIVVSMYNADTLQLLVIAVMIGIAATMLGSNAQKVSDFLNCANELFLKVTSIITSGLPVIVFVSITSLILKTDADSISSYGMIIFAAFISVAAMLIVYMVLILLFTGENPLVFLKAAFPAWFNAFTLTSSNAAMPFTMETCEKRLHISPKVYSFSIPLGATINMDGFTASLTVIVLGLVKGFGIDFTFNQYIMLVISIVLLSMACPGIPGGGLIVLSMIAQQFGIPAEGVALVSSILVLLDPLNTGNNVIGDVAGTYVVAFMEKLVDREDRAEQRTMK